MPNTTVKANLGVAMIAPSDLHKLQAPEVTASQGATSRTVGSGVVSGATLQAQRLVSGTVAPMTAPTAPAKVSPPSTMAQKANVVTGTQLSSQTLAKLKSRTFDTRELGAKWFHGIIYGPTDSRKSTTAAEFGDPDDVRIIIVRNREQLMPVMDKGYQAFHAENWAQLSLALRYPEQIWPDWARRTNRTLILDDLTEGKDMALEDNETTDDGKEVRDLRQVTRGAKEDIREVVKSVLRKPMNFIIVCMAREWDQTKDKGHIAPDLPQSISNLVTTDFEYVFYVRKDLWKFVTGQFRLPGVKKNEKGKDEAYVQTIFAKHKVPKELVGKVLKPLEAMNLR